MRVCAQKAQKCAASVWVSEWRRFDPPCVARAAGRLCRCSDAAACCPGCAALVLTSLDPARAMSTLWAQQVAAANTRPSRWCWGQQLRVVCASCVLCSPAAVWCPRARPLPHAPPRGESPVCRPHVRVGVGGLLPCWCEKKIEKKTNKM